MIGPLALLDVTALVLAVACYGVSSHLLSVGALANPLTSRSWWLGVAFQAAGFGAAFVARRSLPLLVVQPAVAGSVAVTYALGVLLGRWRPRPREISGIAAVVAGVLGVAVVAVPGPSLGIPPRVATLVWVVVAVIAALTFAARGRPTSASGAVGLGWGALAGLAYGAGAVGARALAPGAPGSLVNEPGTTALVVAATVTGQAALTRALAGGAVSGPVAAMYLVATAAPALVGVRWLGDEVAAGGAAIAVTSAVVALAGVVLLTGPAVTAPDRRRPPPA